MEQSARGWTRAIAKAGEDPTLANLSFLERVSVSHGTEAKYRTRVEQFLSFAVEEKLALVVDDEVDAALVQYLTLSYSSEIVDKLQAHCYENPQIHAKDIFITEKITFFIHFIYY